MSFNEVFVNMEAATFILKRWFLNAHFMEVPFQSFLQSALKMMVHNFAQTEHIWRYLYLGSVHLIRF